MTDDDGAAAPARQELDHRRAAVAIEVVGRLIEQGDVRPGEDQRRQPGAGALPAGQRGERRLDRDIEAEPAERRGHAAFERPVDVGKLIGTGKPGFGAALPGQRFGRAEQIGDIGIRGGLHRLMQRPSRPATLTLPAGAARSPAISLSSVVLPTPLRPTSPVRPGPNCSARSENSVRPSGVDHERSDSEIEAGMTMDVSEGKARRHCCRVEIHGSKSPVEAAAGEYDTPRGRQAGGRQSGMRYDSASTSASLRLPGTIITGIGNEPTVRAMIETKRARPFRVRRWRPAPGSRCRHRARSRP